MTIFGIGTVGNNAASYTLMILSFSLDSFQGSALP